MFIEHWYISIWVSVFFLSLLKLTHIFLLVTMSDRWYLISLTRDWICALYNESMHGVLTTVPPRKSETRCLAVGGDSQDLFLFPPQSLACPSPSQNEAASLSGRTSNLMGNGESEATKRAGLCISPACASLFSMVPSSPGPKHVWGCMHMCLCAS